MAFQVLGDKMQSQNNYATKEDLKKLATKEGLERVAVQVARNTVETLSLKEEMKGVHRKLDYIVEAVTDIIGELKNNKSEKAAISSALDRHENRLDNHEKRISALEK